MVISFGESPNLVSVRPETLNTVPTSYLEDFGFLSGPANSISSQKFSVVSLAEKETNGFFMNYFTVRHGH
jgi:hypothetical protein